MKITVEMTEEEYKIYAKFKNCIKNKREARELEEMYKRLQNLANNVYKGLAISDESDDIEIINDLYANAALRIAKKELF